MSTVEVNREGFLVTFSAKDGQRSYACADRRSLVHLVERLTGRKWKSLIMGGDDMPTLETLRGMRITITSPLHIYGQV